MNIANLKHRMHPDRAVLSDTKCCDEVISSGLSIGPPADRSSETIQAK